jgi:hypothetical protein
MVPSDEAQMADGNSSSNIACLAHHVATNGLVEGVRAIEASAAKRWVLKLSPTLLSAFARNCRRTYAD